MESIKDSLAIIKEFFLEILGFFLPGIHLIVGFYFISNEQQQNFFFKFISIDKFSFFIPILSYVVGYFIYGLGQLGFIRSNFIVKTAQIEKDIENSAIFKSVHKSISNTINEPVAYKCKEVRNLAMSYLEQYDIKIYNFMFRAELCHSMSIVVMFLALIGLSSMIFKSLPFRSDSNYFWFYVLLVFSALIFQITRKRFFKIAMELIFPIYASKFIKQGV